MAEVCIIGAGFSGIIAAKVSLFNNLTPFIIEKSDSIGGLWKASSTQLGVWNSLSTNTSKYFLTISDHLWPADTPEFPTNTQFLSYMNSYISKHNLGQFIHFNSQLTQISRSGENYSVTYVENNEIKVKVFKYVICATGFYSIPKDDFENKEEFKGKIIHSGFYREPSQVAGKKVIVVGKAFSSGDLALDALSQAASVTQLYRKAYICNKRRILGAPYDFTFFGLAGKDHPSPLTSTLERTVEFGKFSIAVSGNPGDMLEDWRMTDEVIESGSYNFTVHLDEYFSALKNGNIHCVHGDLKGFYEDGIVLKDGRQLSAEVVILSTGYYTNYSYFSDEIKEIIKYDPSTQKVALTLFRASIHPSLPGLGFVGNFHGPFPGQFELQSELAVKWVTGGLGISQDELWEGVRLEERCKTELKEMNFIYDLGGILQEFFRILEIKIDYALLSSLGYENGIYCPVFYWKDRPGQEDLIREFVREVKSAYPEYRFI